MPTWNRLVLTGIGLVMAISCTKDIDYVKAGATPDDLYWDRYECISPRGSQAYHLYPSQEQIDRCLAKKGWQRHDTKGSHHQ
jgi:hypothetical protein